MNVDLLSNKSASWILRPRSANTISWFFSLTIFINFKIFVYTDQMDKLRGNLLSNQFSVSEYLLKGCAIHGEKVAKNERLRDYVRYLLNESAVKGWELKKQNKVKNFPFFWRRILSNKHSKNRIPEAFLKKNYFE